MYNADKTPIYKRLFEDLKKLIDDGKYNEGELLPSENVLCKTYNTTRSTVRLALIDLMSMGYITRQQGKGSIVSEPRRGLGILSVSGVTAGVGDMDLSTVILQKPIRSSWPNSLIQELTNEEKSAGCIFFARLRYIKKIPVLFEETFLSDIKLPRFISKNLENRSFLKLLQQDYQVEVTGGAQKIWAIAADKEKSKLLKIPLGSPIVHMKRKLKTNMKDLNIYSWIYGNTENYYLDDYF